MKAPFGQAAEQTPQPMHSPFISVPFSEMLMALMGHKSAHMEQSDFGVRNLVHKDASTSTY
jgi:hypothetical protein